MRYQNASNEFVCDSCDETFHISEQVQSMGGVICQDCHKNDYYRHELLERLAWAESIVEVESEGTIVNDRVAHTIRSAIRDIADLKARLGIQ